MAYKKRFIKNYIIYPQMQKVFIKLNLLIIVIFLISMIISNFLNFSKLKSVGLAAGLKADDQFFQFLNHAEFLFLMNIIFIAVILLLLGFISTVWVSHKIAGPVYRLRRYFIDLSEGKDPGPLSFRKGDYLQDMAEIINKKKNLNV